MKRFITPLLVTLALIISLTAIVRTQTTPQPKAQAYESKTFVAPVSDVGLELMGNGGWELITVATVPTDHGPQVEYFFKRPK